MIRPLTNLKGLATGIGSLPYQDVDLALDLIFKYTPHIPFWPQLPKRDIREGMIIQFSENIPCLRQAANGLFFDSQKKDKELELFYERIIAEDIDYFKISQDFALGLYRFYQHLERSVSQDIAYIKCQVTGPFTFAAAIRDENGIALLHDRVFMQVVLKAMTMKALWQIKLFKPMGKKIIMFLDEPYLGCFGSAYTPINKEEVIRYLSELATTLKSDDVLLGVHCCGNTDWSIFTEITSIDIISFDAFSFQDRFVLYADNLKDFLKRKGIICWGIVPTQEFTDEVTLNLLLEKIKCAIHILVEKGLEKDLLLGQLFLSPSCGLGSLNPEKSTRILSLLSEVSYFIRNPHQAFK